MQQRATPEQALALIERHLRQGHTHFTLTEAAAMSGLSIDAAREALDICLHKYICRLQVSEYGDLIYNFGAALRRRGVKTWGEWTRQAGAWLWQLFTVLYKAWIALTLVVYFVVFLVLLLLLIVASSSRRSQDNRRAPSSSMLDLTSFLHLFLMIFRWRTVPDTGGYPYDYYGSRQRHDRSTSAERHKPQKNFIAAVYDFVFGSPRAVPDPLQSTREAAAYLQQHKGLIVPAELCALGGWTFPQAETVLTDCIIRYQGEGKISDNAVLYGQFDTITRAVGAIEATQVVWYWDKHEPDYVLTGNSATQNWLIGGMNSVNLLFAFLALNGLFDEVLRGQFHASLAIASAGGAWVHLLLGWLPLIFSLLFFLVPLARLARIQVLRRHRRIRNRRKRLFKAIFAHQGQSQTVAAITATVNTHARNDVLSAPEVETLMKELALDMPGDMLVNDRAEVEFTFPRITREWQDVEMLRRQRRVDDQLGTIIIESDNV